MKERIQKILANAGVDSRRNVEEMIRQKMTFEEALNGSGFTIMAKQRLRVVQRELFEQLDAIPFVQ